MTAPTGFIKEPDQFPQHALSIHMYDKGTANMAACTNVRHSSSDHYTRAPCCFTRCLNEELIITANLALSESSRTRCVLDKQMNHRQLDPGTGTIKSTSEAIQMFIFMRGLSTSVSSKTTLISFMEGNNTFL